MTTSCSKGINTLNWGGQNFSILNHASSKGYRDLLLSGSFCPREEGSFRLIFEGTPSYSSSSYSFNSISGRNRTTPYHYLDSNTCYPYSIYQSIDYSDDNFGILYFQKMDEQKQVITSDYSLTCVQIVCMKGSKHPLSVKLITCNHLKIHSNLFISFLFLFIYI